MKVRTETPAPLPEDLQLFTVKEVARSTKWSRALIYKLAERGQIPHIRCGKTLRFTREDLLAFIKGNRK